MVPTRATAMPPCRQVGAQLMARASARMEAVDDTHLAQVQACTRSAVIPVCVGGSDCDRYWDVVGKEVPVTHNRTETSKAIKQELGGGHGIGDESCLACIIKQKSL